MADEDPIFTEDDYPGLHMLEEIRVAGPVPWPRALVGVVGFWPWFAVKHKLAFAFMVVVNVVVGWVLCTGGDAYLFWSAITAVLLAPIILIGAMIIPFNAYRSFSRK